MFYVGFLTSSLALAASVAALVVVIISLIRKQTQLPGAAVLLVKVGFFAHSAAVLILMVMQVLQDYSNVYVVSVINPAMPWILKLTALWGGQTGSLFFWSWIVSLCVFMALTGKKHLFDNWSLLVVTLNQILFLALSLIADNPFTRVWALQDGSLVTSLFAPQAGAVVERLNNGMGLNPLLRHPGMIIHPPLLYIGYALYLVPFAVGISTLVRGSQTEHLLDQTRTWLLAAWVFLGAGIVLGSWWSYDVLGWGGYWAWDPVETASLMPWLASTALLHSLLLERRKNIFQRFNLLLVLSSYLLVVFSIFVTRSGLVNSVHAFGESSISVPLLVFMLFLLLGSLGLLIWRWKSINSEWKFGSAFSRDALFLYTNIILMALVLICLWGLIFPLLNGALTGVEMTLHRGFYDRSTTPLFALLVILMAVCPIVGWNAAQIKQIGKKIWIPLTIATLGLMAVFLAGVRQAWALGGVFIVVLGFATLIYLTIRDGKAVGLRKFASFFWKQRARYGAWLVHAGILLIALGVIGMGNLAASIEGTMVPGEKMPLRDYEIEFVSVRESFENPEYLTVSAETVLYKDGKEIARLNPAQHIYPDRQQYVTIPDAHATLKGDVYTLLAGYDVDVPYITLRLSDNPLVNFLWIGGIFLSAGGTLAATLPGTRSNREEETSATEKSLESTGAADL
ncbi:MAG TPA: cytochrome c-type biogenesis CcmF C-terminal domain-containing protein [Anaerolineaceae bacterium]|nr:cytochrome c-type biogenesis CcmF C-terminal domain-containing protein [Anaerolineaceae bacterium]HOG77024.1 cytochrome c-type biogenesis CcmF C-terminal domain-containing protein [Anaerolineaceae bacterium]